MNRALICSLVCFVSFALFSADLDDIAAKNTKLEAFIRQEFPENGPGGALIVIHDGKKIFEKAFGFADVSERVPIALHTNFELASCSKQFTAMAIMMLEEEGKLKFTDKLSKFLPEFKEIGDEITIAHLLHHTSGLQDYFDVFDKHGSGTTTSHRVLEVLAKHGGGLKFKPGSKYEYSNSGYMVLAQIVEKASGQRYPAFLKEKIFEPLKMEDTLVYDETKPHIKHCAACYRHTKDGGFKKMEHDDWDCVYGDGSVRSTVEDLFKWDQALYTEKLVSSKTLEEAFTEGKLNNGKGTEYGYGWGIDKFQRHKAVYHEGEWLGFENFIYRIPELKFSAIFLSNGSFSKKSEKLMNEIPHIYFPGKRAE